MEKSRAIELLEHLAWDRDIERNPYGDALNMAIEALKTQLSCEGATSDTISRQWLLECVDEGWIKFDTEKDANRFIHLVRDIAPCAQPEPGDYKHESVKALDSFTKAFCKDNQVKDDLIFRCHNCAFEMPDKTCLVKVMARRLCPEYKDFGSMGDL